MWVTWRADAGDVAVWLSHWFVRQLLWFVSSQGCLWWWGLLANNMVVGHTHCGGGGGGGMKREAMSQFMSV